MSGGHLERGTGMSDGRAFCRGQLHQIMFLVGTKKYRNPHSVRLCGFFVVRKSPRESPEASSFSTIISTTRAVVLNSVVLRGNMDKKTRETGTNRLTDTKVKTAKAETKESTLPDGEGLDV